MLSIDYASYKSQTHPKKYGVGHDYIKLRLSVEQAEKFDAVIKDMSIIKSRVTYKGKAYVHYYYRGTSANATYMNIVKLLKTKAL